uniref:Pentacotripeptide-repeat region of PRORP domain-containing protein n=1 Tax=Lactuca sativa TaxID=4236 RepID=A0A9R1V4Z9_LACSA|nr:hypothetical protein LSAT_V11C600310890 [Lactuca sativa]
MKFMKLVKIQIPPSTAQTVHHHHHIPNGLNYAAYDRLIQHCTNHRLIRQGKLLHAKLILSSVTLDNFLASKLIAFYSKTNNLFEAQQVFEQLPNKNTFSWNALFRGYSMNKHHTDTLMLFRSFLSASSMSVKPDYYIVTCVLKAFSSLGYHKSNFTKTIHCFIIRNRLDSNIFFVNALIKLYCRCKDMVKARSLFDHAPKKDLVSWNFMMAGYSQRELYNECKELYFKMLSLEDIRPNEFTVISILEACAQSNDLDLGMKVLRFVIDNEIKTDLPVCNAFIKMYAKCSDIIRYNTHQLFVEMTKKDEISYGSLISGYILHGFVMEAMNLFREMKKPCLSIWNVVISGHFQNNQYEKVIDLLHEMQENIFKPNSVTLSIIFPTLSHLSNLKGSKETHAYAIRNSYDTNIDVASGIIDTYAKLGFLDRARIVFDQSEKKSVIIWRSIISAYSSHGDVNTTLDLFNQMTKEGIYPDPMIVTFVLSACADHYGYVNEALSH